MQDQGNDVSFCPSFSYYSSDQTASVAARVTQEEGQNSNQDDGDVRNDDFEFALLRPNHDNDSPVFQLFNRDLQLINDDDDMAAKDARAISFPLRNLFIDDDRDPPSSSSSSEADELEGVPAGTYCVWTPKASPSPGRCKKSNSTGSSTKPRGLRLKDLLRRSSSDGKQSFVFLNPNNNSRIISSSSGSDGNNLGKKKEEKAERGKTTTTTTTTAAAGKEKVSAHEVFYVRNKALQKGEKRKSYLPYRQDLVGFFANANFRPTFPPF